MHNYNIFGYNAPHPPDVQGHNVFGVNWENITGNAMLSTTNVSVSTTVFCLHLFMGCRVWYPCVHQIKVAIQVRRNS